MNELTTSDLQELLSDRPGPAVTIHAPMKPGGGANAKQNRTRFKNLTREAERQVSAGGVGEAQAQALLQPALRLLEEEPFWGRQTAACAVFAAPGFFRYYELPLPTEESVVSGARFHLAPLLPVINIGQFYVLDLGQKHVRMLRCTAQAASEVEARDLPHSLEQALGYEAPQRGLQFRAARARGSPQAASVFSRAGAQADDAKQDILRYLQRLDRGLHDLLREEQAPLVLAAVDYMHALYRTANTYPALLEQGIEGNVQRLTPDQLRRRALPVMLDHVAQLQERAAQEFDRLVGTPRACNDIKEIAPAAYAGHVEVLLVRPQVHHWGTFDPASGKVELHNQPHPGDEELMDFAVAHTLRHRGRVWALQPGGAPAVSAVGAIYRF